MICPVSSCSVSGGMMFFCDEEGTQSSFKGVKDVIEAKGLFCSLYTNRASHYRHTPEAGGKADKVNLTQLGRAMKQLGVEMIPAYSPQAREDGGRFETRPRCLLPTTARQSAASGRVPVGQGPSHGVRRPGSGSGIGPTRSASPGPGCGHRRRPSQHCRRG